MLLLLFVCLLLLREAIETHFRKLILNVNSQQIPTEHFTKLVIDQIDRIKDDADKHKAVGVIAVLLLVVLIVDPGLLV